MERGETARSVSAPRLQRQLRRQRSDGVSTVGERIVDRLEVLARFSESPDSLTRRSFTPEHREAVQQVRTWMEAAGMSTRLDPIGNVIGRYEGTREGPALLMGSHLDTVRNAGRFDGMLGVVLPIEIVGELAAQGRRMPFPIEVVGFCDEEGVRFQSTLLGSLAVAGRFDPALLDATDDDGVSLAQALTTFGLDPRAVGAATRAPGELLGYLEVHIEQGPVLDSAQLPVGVVTAIAGASRFVVEVGGEGGHAGTVPMGLRQDALAAAAEAVLAVESICRDLPSCVGTVGDLGVVAGAVNVIPGQVRFTLDVRAADEPVRASAINRIRSAFDQIAKVRGVSVAVERTHDSRGCECDLHLSELLARSVAGQGIAVRRLPSGAGHDAMALTGLCPVAMLFVRCAAGISHHPAESMTAADADVAARVVAAFLEQLCTEGWSVSAAP